MNKMHIILLILVILAIALVIQKMGRNSSIDKKTEEVLSGSSLDRTSGTSRDQVEQAKLFKEDLAVGGGEEAVLGNTAVVHYRGVLADGTQFDSSYERGQSFSFVLGAGQVIRGWDEGVLGMKVGGKRKLVIPPALAYGDYGVPGAIPPKATLTFEVELLGIK